MLRVVWGGGVFERAIASAGVPAPEDDILAEAVQISAIRARAIGWLGVLFTSVSDEVASRVDPLVKQGPVFYIIIWGMEGP